MARPATGRGKAIKVYLTPARQKLLGDDPVRAIYKLIDAMPEAGERSAIASAKKFLEAAEGEKPDYAAKKQERRYPEVVTEPVPVAVFPGAGRREIAMACRPHRVGGQGFQRDCKACREANDR